MTLMDTCCFSVARAHDILKRCDVEVCHAMSSSLNHARTMHMMTPGTAVKRGHIVLSIPPLLIMVIVMTITSAVGWPARWTSRLATCRSLRKRPA